MGLESRDYYRRPFDSSGHRGGGTLQLAPVCKYLIIANVVVYVLQLFSPDVQSWLQLETEQVIHRAQVWRLLSYAFCHSQRDILHIVFNMLLLFWFGRTLEAMYGSREFLWFYLSAALLAGLAFIGLDLATGRSASAIGASGAVMAVMVLYAIYYPRQTILVFFVIPLEIRWLVVIYVVYDLSPVLAQLLGRSSTDGIAHAAHLGGLAFGFLYWKYNLRLAPWVDRLRAPRLDRWIGARRRIRIYHPSRPSADQDLDRQVDRILQKIHEHGEHSLSDQEREVLKTASERYKNK